MDTRFLKLKVAILGSGNVGTDLLIKVSRSPYLECTRFIGRDLTLPGMLRAKNINVPISDQSINAIIQEPGCCDLVFDATSARCHREHWPVLKRLGKFVIDLTPSQIGTMVIPSINLNQLTRYHNVNMVSCGGQAAIPLIYAMSQVQEGIQYIEEVSSIASQSAGPATRVNMDEYIENTEQGIRIFSGCKNVKAILILNPAQPCIDLQTTISVKVDNPNMYNIKKIVPHMVKKIQTYVPGYTLIVPPVYEKNRIVVMVRVKGLGDYLPSYAGNLDIINCAAIATAEQYVKELNQSPRLPQGTQSYAESFNC